MKVLFYLLNFNFMTYLMTYKELKNLSREVRLHLINEYFLFNINGKIYFL